MPGISTVALHADRKVHPTRAVAPPIYQTATFWAEDAEQFAQAAVNAFLGTMRYARRSASLGGVDSLAVHPASMWRGMLSEDQIAASGVPLGLVRLAAGTEDTPDLVADALAAADALMSDSPDNLGEGIIP